ncbi:hypothetical protein M2164_005975 [Streptomyces sp. SAI-208]|uniref:hypothetical protein n=1 Tax=Streptomyces sp. SAI-208 TaxID=2940550 RepID=UPI00247382B6|nr:hypothetical protein [Streptomyces sp. SAI-208]MDH6610340.1 hypothetical protein [Streptomyces sp. SAI-208]
MSLTPPPDGTATYNAPLTIRWSAYDLFTSSLTIPVDLADVLSDSDLDAITAVVDNALKTRFPTLHVSRYTSWTSSAPNTFDQVTVQEASD